MTTDGAAFHRVSLHLWSSTGEKESMIANEYEALTPDAMEVCDVFEAYFTEFAKDNPGFTIRELEYLATDGIKLAAAGMILVQAHERKQRKDK